MSKEVWVTWKNPSTGARGIDTVTDLKENAQIKDLRKAFVAQQLLHVSPGEIQVCETEGDEELKASTDLTKYFLPRADDSAGSPGPGKSEGTPLFLRLPQQRLQDHQKEFLRDREQDRDKKLTAVFDHLLQVKEDSETLVISKPQTAKYTRAISRIEIRKDAPTWHDKQATTSHNSPGFTWLDSKEDSPDNRAAYMAYLRNAEHVNWPPNTEIFDGNGDNDLLSVSLQGFDVKTSGNIDVVLAYDHHQSLTTVRENMLGALELKKDTNKDHSKIERQAVLQHIASSYINPNTGILTVMTDLHARWHFFWFVREKRLMRYEATESDALFLIEHMLDEAESISTPTGFLARACWNDLFLAQIPEGAESVSPDRRNDKSGFEDNVQRDTDEDGKDCPPRDREARSMSQGQRNKGGGHHAAMEHIVSSSSLEFMDEEEELEAVLRMALETSFHRMFPPSEKARSLPPSQIQFQNEHGP